MAITEWRRAWADVWHGRADRMREEWATYVARWEFDTEPGYPMTRFDCQRRDLALSVANLCDALGGRRRAN